MCKLKKKLKKIERSKMLENKVILDYLTCENNRLKLTSACNFVVKLVKHRGFFYPRLIRQALNKN